MVLLFRNVISFGFMNFVSLLNCVVNCCSLCGTKSLSTLPDEHSRCSLIRCTDKRKSIPKRLSCSLLLLYLDFLIAVRHYNISCDVLVTIPSTNVCIDRLKDFNITRITHFVHTTKIDGIDWNRVKVMKCNTCSSMMQWLFLVVAGCFNSKCTRFTRINCFLNA